MKKIHGVLLAGSMVLAGTQVSAAAFTIQGLQAIGQANFQNISDDLSAAIWMNPSNSAEPHSAGIIPVGFQVGVEATSLQVNSTAWQKLGNAGQSGMIIPKLRISAGIPFGLDFSYMYTAIPQSNIKITGYEGRIAFGSMIPLPMVEFNVRAYQSKLTGVPELSVKDTGYAAMLGADLPIFKPYIEVGQVQSTSTPQGIAATGGFLKEYKKTSTTMAIGAKVSIFPFLNLTGEYATVGSKKLYTLKLAAEF
ncbi:MAG: hypothetical protein COA61_009250 [Zetaproteobacteria bacterium]|nr:hypothetical protein [Zetaproteobacteria bacterium]